MKDRFFARMGLFLILAIIAVLVAVSVSKKISQTSKEFQSGLKLGAPAK